MKQANYNIEVKNLIEKEIAINNGHEFSKYKANKYKEAVKIYCIRNIKDLEARKEVYYKYIKKIDKQTDTGKIDF